MIIDEFAFTNSIGLDLPSRLYYREEIGKRGVIFSHGLFSSKDGYKITNMAEDIVNAGYTLMTFDFTFSGESPGDIADISILQEVDDLLRGVEVFKKKGIEKIHLMGSSMGGVVSILAASRGNTVFESLMLIATPVYLTGLIREGAVEEKGNDMVSISGVDVKKSFIHELENLDIAAAAEKISAPVLIIHGMLDNIVSIENFEVLKGLLRGPSEAVLIADGDHNLTGESHLRIIGERINNWLGKFTV